MVRGREGRLRSVSERFASAANGLVLDKINAGIIAAYSTRKLRSGYSGSAIRVRRSSDNTEQDIGFTVGGDLNTTALASFVGANSAFIVTWYDQSGSARNLGQATTTLQPRIVNSGTIDTLNTRPIAVFDGSNDRLFVLSASLTVAQPLSRNIVARYRGKTSASVVFDSNDENNAMVFYNGETPGQFRVTTGTTPTFVAADIGASNLNLNVFTHLLNTTETVTFLNGTSTTTVGNHGNNLFGVSLGNIRAGIDNGYSFQGDVCEVILTTGALSTPDRQSIERNQGTYFSVAVA